MKQRDLKPNEALCKYGCKTIVDKALNSCEMCCEKAIAERLARVAPLVKEALEKAEVRAEKLRSRIAKLMGKAKEVKEDVLDFLTPEPKAKPKK